MSSSSTRRGTARPPAQEADCPRRFKTTLVDVVQSGNAPHALGLAQGDELALTVDGAKVLVSNKTIQIGALPPQYSRIVACISLGWKYSATVVEAEGTPEDPTIRVLVVGAPGQP